MLPAVSKKLKLVSTSSIIGLIVLISLGAISLNSGLAGGLLVLVASIWTHRRSRAGGKVIEVQSISYLEKLKNKRRDISKAQYLENVQNQGELLSNLSQQIYRQFVHLDESLRRQFDPNEMAFSRYQATVESANEQAWILLEKALQILKALNQTPKTTQSQERLQEFKELTDQIIIIGKEFDNISRQLEKLNDKAAPEFNLMIEDLQKLANRTSQYNLNQRKGFLE